MSTFFFSFISTEYCQRKCFILSVAKLCAFIGPRAVQQSMPLKKLICQRVESFRLILFNVLMSVGMIQGVGKFCFQIVFTLILTVKLGKTRAITLNDSVSVACLGPQTFLIILYLYVDLLFQLELLN